jgi:hypothetical protein
MDFLVHMKAAKQDHGHQEGPSDLSLRLKGLLESLLVEKPLVDGASLLVRKEILHRMLR